MSIWIRLGGRMPATELAAHSAPTWETLADGGNGESSFDLSISTKVLPPLLATGTLLEIMCGPRRLWLGRIGDYDRTEGRVVGRGIHTDAYQIPALDSGGNVTRNFLSALNVAASAPWNWLVGNPNGVSGVASGDATSPQMVGQLADELAAELGKRWGQGPDGDLYLQADPSTPTWLATPEAAAFGQTSESEFTVMLARYFNGTANVTSAPVFKAGSEVRTDIKDYTDKGTLTAGQVATMLQTELGMTAPGWVNGVTLHREQLTTMGGTPAFLPAVTARTMMRAHGLLADGVVQAPWLDVVIGKTRYTAGEDVIHLEPANKAARTFTDVIAAA